MQKSDDLKKIKELLEIVKHKVGKIELTQIGQSASIHLMRDQQSVMNEKIDELQEDLQDVKSTQDKQVLPSVTYIETHIKAYKDAYQTNNANAKKLEKRVEVLEDQADIIPPPEYILAEVQ